MGCFLRRAAAKGMTSVFYISGVVAVLASIMVITRLNAVHSLMYMAVALSAVAVTLFALGAPFVAALEVIIYAGAILVLFVFVIMMLNLGPAAVGQERAWLGRAAWLGPGLLAAVLLAEMVWLLTAAQTPAPVAQVGPDAVGRSLFGPYVLTVELASMLLLSGLVGAYHIGRREGRPRSPQDFRTPQYGGEHAPPPQRQEQAL
jgi:NADH-quinone oxidoreductase subunit J